MLFDLRGRGRRRTVRVIYTGLALLMGVGLVGFGIGGGFGGGGLLNAATNSEGGSSASFANQIKKYRKLTEEKPSDLSAWEGLTKNMLHEAGSETYVSNAGVATSKGKALYRETSQAWKSYIALNPPKPSLELSKEMLNVYGEGGLDEPAQAVDVLQLVVAAEPKNTAYYAQLAVYAYRAKNAGLGDLASEKAVSLAPAAQKVRLKNELAEIKKNPSGEKTYTTTTNGKTYAVTKGSNGKYEGVEIPKTTSSKASKTTSSPTKTTSTTKK
jgi:hypothetical protein